MVKLSIIIPVYNGEKYIENCVNSIIKSNIKDYEILLINDGSMDNTKEIFDKINNNETIRCFNITHRGLSETRNFGLENARGEYISFVDVDDEVIDYSIDLSENYDLLIFGYILDFVEEGYKIPFNGINEVYLKPADSLKTLFDLDLFNFAWNKVYKKDIIKNLKFSDKYYQGEDLAFNVEVFKKIRNLKVMSEAFYIYKKRNIETMASKFVKNYEIVLNNKFNLLKDILDETTLNDYMIKELEVFVINLYKTSVYSFKERNSLIKENVLTHLSLIKKANTNSLYSKIFKNVCLSNNAVLINIIYECLTFFKNILGIGYLKIRKKVYLNDSKTG